MQMNESRQMRNRWLKRMSGYVGFGGNRAAAEAHLMPGHARCSLNGRVWAQRTLAPHRRRSREGRKSPQSLLLCSG